MAKLSYPKTNEEKAKLYMHCMVEVKERLNVIVVILGLPIAPLFAQELCYLQLRYICELIAIACLAAQGDYETQRSFTESYKPPEIFKALRDLYPDFFPKVATRTITPNPNGHGPRHHHVDFDHKPDVYRESDITSLWGAAGSHLHRASVRKYLQTTFDNPPPKLDGVARHVSKLVELLNSHIIPIQKEPKEDVRILFEMGQNHEPVRLLFLHFDHVNKGVSVVEHTAELKR